MTLASEHTSAGSVYELHIGVLCRLNHVVQGYIGCFILLSRFVNIIRKKLLYKSCSVIAQAQGFFMKRCYFSLPSSFKHYGYMNGRGCSSRQQVRKEFVWIRPRIAMFYYAGCHFGLFGERDWRKHLTHFIQYFHRNNKTS